MPSPITPAELRETMPEIVEGQTRCEFAKRIPTFLDRFCTFWEWMFDAGGGIGPMRIDLCQFPCFKPNIPPPAGVCPDLYIIGSGTPLAQGAALNFRSANWVEGMTYTLRRSVNADMSSSTDEDTGSTPAGGYGFADSGLSDDTYYYYQLDVLHPDCGSEHDFSNIVAVKTTPAGCTQADIGISASAASDTEARIDLSGIPADGWDVSIFISNDSRIIGQLSAAVDTGGYRFSLPNMTPGTWFFTAVIEEKEGCRYQVGPASVSFSAPVTAAPVASINGTVVSWGTVTGATLYKVYVNGQVKYTTANTTVSLAGDVTCDVQVSAVNSQGIEGAKSNSVHYTADQDVVPPPPSISINGYLLLWHSVTGAVSYNVYRRLIGSLQGYARVASGLDDSPTGDNYYSFTWTGYTICVTSVSATGKESGPSNIVTKP